MKRFNGQGEADVLEAAADRIEVKGWCQEALFLPTPKDTVCIKGAMLWAIKLSDGSNLLETGLDVDCDEVDKAFEYFNDLNNAVGRHIGLWSDSAGEYAYCLPTQQWNDADGRTQYEVIDALRETAKDLRNERINDV